MRFQTHSTQVRTFAVSATVIDPDGKPFAVNTTDFKVSKAHQDALVENGRRAAIEFLDDLQARGLLQHAARAARPGDSRARADSGRAAASGARGRGAARDTHAARDGRRQA